MNLSKTAAYSMSVMSYMAMNPEIRMSAAYLNRKLSIPYPYLRQILKELSHHGFITSLKGRSGGFIITKKKSEISLADIIESTDGLESINKCILGFEKCPFDVQCPMHKIWEETRNGMIRILSETTLADLLVKNGNNNDITE
jgi:Rrf2 family transcriptional regulator, iron-sulfur cluster assembly transcription factor